MSYNPQSFWKEELGNIDAWKKHANTSPAILKSIERTKNIVLPEILKRKKSIGGTFLDAGCGSGYAANVFIESGEWTEGYGLDFQQHRIDLCKEKFKDESRLKFDVKNLQDTGLPDKSVNMIYTGAVLQHIPLVDKVKTVQEFKRILTDDGFYFGHEVINPESVGISHHGHIINVDMKWLNEQFSPFIVEEVVLHFDTYNFQIIYAHK